MEGCGIRRSCKKQGINCQALGVIRDRTSKVRSRADLIIALIPTTRLREVASILEEVYGKEILHLTDLALNLHEFQYNGLDPEGGGE